MKNFTEHQEQDSVQPSVELKVIGRGEAKSLGLKRYFTGRPCIRGHLEERLTSSNVCCGCSRERARRLQKSRSEYFKSYYKTEEYKSRKKILVKKPENRKQMNKRAREYYQENKEIMRKKAIVKYYKMTDEQKDSMRKTRDAKRRTPESKSIDAMRNMVFRCLRLTGKRKSTRTEDILGYKKSDLVKNLESKFTEGMSWDNYAKEWEIDHIIPVSYCVKIGIENPSIINQLDNLNPLSISENREKSDKIPIGLSLRGIKTYWGEDE